MRSRTDSKVYIEWNRLHVMVVLRFRPGSRALDIRWTAMSATAAFIKRLRNRIGPFPYWYTAEFGPEGGGWHIHLLLDRLLSKPLLEDLWPGFVEQKDEDFFRHSQKRVGSAQDSVLDLSQRAATYCTKWENEEDLADRHGHLYASARGYAPEPVKSCSTDRRTALVAALGLLGNPERYTVWRSDDDPHWKGPPVMKIRVLEERHPPTPTHKPRKRDMGNVVSMLPTLEELAVLLYRAGRQPHWLDSKEIPGGSAVVALCPIDEAVPHLMQADGDD